MRLLQAAKVAAANPNTKIIQIELDIAKLESCKAAIEKVISEAGRIDVLVNVGFLCRPCQFNVSRPLDKTAPSHNLFASTGPSQFHFTRSLKTRTQESPNSG
jgi:NAD(P)-dependent dehydrogenase (short-subunit alcohol dehydrogenase family)